MRALRLLMLLTLLLLGAGTAQAGDGRACGGRTLTGSGACCISGTVTLKGEPVEGAVVTVRLAHSKIAASDATEYVEGDQRPTYGFTLHEAPLNAKPGDVLLITVSYEGWERQLTHTVAEGEQWLDLALDGPAGPAASDADA